MNTPRITPDVNVYELRNAADKIYGYYLPKPHENENATFERAHAECLKNLRHQL